MNRSGVGLTGTVLAAVCLSFTVPEAQAEVRLTKVFGDNMMVQRNQPIRVWGMAATGEVVKVALAGKAAEASANKDGCWSVELPALKEGENLELTVTGTNTLTFKNVIVGDVWVCSGQSNMFFPLNETLGGGDDIKNSGVLSKIRQLRIPTVSSDYRENDLPSAVWSLCSAPKIPGNITAVGFHFAREIHTRTGVPIGIVDCSWGGQAIDPFTPSEGMALIPSLKGVLEQKEKGVVKYQTIELPNALNELERWVVNSKALLAQGTTRLAPQPKMPAPPTSSGIYNAMIHPLIHFPIKGVIWYQGESNMQDGYLYADKFAALIGGWRKQWGQGDFPFYFAQLANYHAAMTPDAPIGGDGYTCLRDAQLKTLALPNTGMAVTIDIGEEKDIHPKNKYDVGLRLARWALARDYGQKALVPSGPLFSAMKIEGEKIRVSFEYVGSGLMIGKKTGREPAIEEKNGKLKRFAIAGEDKKWVWADAVIEGGAVVVSAPGVKAPVAVRYAYSQTPEGANLYNKEGLPASPFRTDSW